MARKKTHEEFLKDVNIPLFRSPWTEIDSIPIILHEILKEKSSTTIEKFLVTE